jgi:ATP-binding cassette subfamily B protein
MKAFPSYKQYDKVDCGPTCLQIIAKHYGRSFHRDFLREKCFINREGVSALGICEGAETIGLRSLGVNVSFDKLREAVPLPCIAYWRQRHFVVVYKVTDRYVHVSDPAYGILKYTKEKFMEGWFHTSAGSGHEQEGLLILLEPTPKFYEENAAGEKSKTGMQFLLAYFRPHKAILVQLLIGLVLTSVIQFIFPFLTQSLVDYGINYQNIQFIYIVLMGQLMLSFSQNFLRIIRDWLLLNMSARVNLTLLSDFLIKVMKLPITFFESKMIGDFVQRVDDHQRVENFLSSETLNIIFSIFSFVIFGIVLSYFSVSVFLLYLFGTALYISWVLMFMKKRAELDYKFFDQSSRNRSSLIQLINGMQEIKLNNSEKRRRWEWEEIQVVGHKLSMKNLSLLQYQRNGGMFISEIQNILITFFTAQQVITGNLTLGAMLAIQYIIGQLNNPIRFLISFVQQFQDAKLSMDRIQEVHKITNEEDEAITTTSLPADRNIAIQGLSFRYGGTKSPEVLKGIDMLIPQGKVTAIVGQSGSGKTTLLKLLLKFYRGQEGTIVIGNSRLDNINASFWRSQCGVVMQDGYIFDDTILRNITESSSMGIIDKERLREAVRIANLEEFIETLPIGYNTKLGASGISLSGGQNQRILIARSVYKNPEFLFFDEATSSLDANNERVIMENLEEFFIGKTVVVIAHRLSTVKKADQIVVLDNGRIVETGNHAELTLQRGHYFNLVKNQLELGN